MADLSNTLMSDFSKLNEDDIVRGHLPGDIAERCLERCRAYIGGSWANATSPADISIKRITGGLANLMIHVHLNESVPRTANYVYPNEPSDVAIKFYFEKYLTFSQSSSVDRFDEINILSASSQMGICPKVYGISQDGYVQDFHKVNSFIL